MLALVLALTTLILPPDTSLCGTQLAPPQPSNHEWFWAVSEIPTGSIVKYEVDPATGRVFADRFMAMPVAYPGNYGFFPGSLAGDGDPLDVIVLTREPLAPGTIIAVRPVGILPMLDGGEQDDKVIAVPTDRIDPSYARIRELDDLPQAELDRIEAFFDTYKLLPAGMKVIERQGRGSREDAVQAIRSAIAVCR
jgi:inorganic pyrophosphatase